MKRVRVYEITRRLRSACDELGIPSSSRGTMEGACEAEVVVQSVRRNIGRLSLKPLIGLRLSP